MGLIDLAAMRAEVKFTLDNRQDMTSARLTQWVNWAYLHVANPKIYRHNELQATQSITLVAGTDTYALADALFAIDSVSNTTHGHKLWPNTIDDFDLSPQTTGSPRQYARWGRNLHLRSNPAAADAGDNIQVRYLAEPTVLSGDTDLTVIDGIWDEVIIVGAVWRGWRALNRPDREEISRAAFAAQINDVKEVRDVEAEDDGYRFEPQVQRYQR